MAAGHTYIHTYPGRAIILDADQSISWTHLTLPNSVYPAESLFDQGYTVIMVLFATNKALM